MFRFVKGLCPFLVFSGIPTTAVLQTYGYYDLIIYEFDGSSSMRVMVSLLLRKYIDDNKETKSNVVFNVATSGSSVGLSKIFSSDGEFALVSHDVSHLPEESYKNNWKTKKIKHIPLAKEFILVFYKPIDGCDKDLILSKDNIQSFYSFFSGFLYDNNLQKNFKVLMDNDDKCSGDIVPWVKNLGPSKSGTSKAFADNPLLNDVCNGKSGSEKTNCEQWLKNVKSGYGSSMNLNYTPESTNLHWNNFSVNLVPGSITYLPSSFVFLNWNEIQSKGLKMAYLKISNDSLFLTKENYKTKVYEYKWGRVFNLVYSVENIKSNNAKKELIEGMVERISELEKLELYVYKYKLKKSNDSVQGATEIDIEKEDDVNDIWKSVVN